MREQINFRLLSKFTGRNFCENKLRNFVLILVTVITTAMILTFNVLITNMDNAMQSIFNQQAGTNAHIELKKINENDIKKIDCIDEIKEYGVSIPLGEIVVEGQKTDMEIVAMDELYAKHMFLEPDYGTMPIASDEVVLDTSILKKLGVPAKIGEQITLRWKRAKDDLVEEKVFRLVGYWISSGKGKECAWISCESNASAKETFREVTVVFNRKIGIDKMSEKIIKNLGLTLDQYKKNWAYDDNALAVLQKEKLIYYGVILLILVSGVLVLFNVMQISVRLDIKLYGRMKTIGSSSRQIKFVVFSQIFVMGIIGIFVGLIIGGVFARYIIAKELMTYFQEMVVSIYKTNIISTVALMLTALFGCGIIPAKTASKVSATEILKEDNSFGFSEKNHGSRFGFPFIFQLSLMNLGRNKARSIISIGFMTIGLVMLNCVYVINESFDIEKYIRELSICDISIVKASFIDDRSIYDSTEMVLPDVMVKQLETMEGIIEKGYLRTQETDLKLSEEVREHIVSYYEANDGEILDFMSYDVNWSRGYQNMAKNGECIGTIYGIDGLVVNSLMESECLLQGSYDGNKFSSGNYAIAQGIYSPSDRNKNQPTYKIGDIVTLEGKKFEIMAIVEAPIPIVEGKRSEQAAFSLSFFIPSRAFENIYSEVDIRKLYFNVNLTGYKNISEYFNEQGREEFLVTSETTLQEKYRKETRALMVFQILVSIIIFGIGLLNMINSMITAIITRQKEFGIMQSLGMTKKQLKVLLIFEGLDYSVITLILSYFISLLFCSTVIKLYIESQWSATYRLSVDPLLICTPIIIIVSFAIPLLCYAQIVIESHNKEIE